MTPEQIAAIVAHFSYELEPTTPLPDWNTVAMDTVYLRNELATLRAERGAVVEQCAVACDKIAGNTADFSRDHRRAAGQCAAMIRALKGGA